MSSHCHILMNAMLVYIVPEYNLYKQRRHKSTFTQNNVPKSKPYTLIFCKSNSLLAKIPLGFIFSEYGHGDAKEKRYES